jgi:RNA 2',3'-cyclic 3'-phosphodiesterase
MSGDNAPAEKKIRAFVALKTPPAWNEKLGELQGALKAKFRGGAVRWVNPEQIHITLRFFGWVTEVEVQEIVKVIPQICAGRREFRLNCEGLGCFPSVRRPRVFWAGLSGELEEGVALNSEITAATKMFGEPPEDRPFKPHLTLARLKEPDRRAIAELEHSIERGFRIEDPWLVNEVLLMRSHLGREGSRYETLKRWKLG